MLKLTNRLLQWLHSVPKPLFGLFRHLKRSKNEEDSLLEVSPFNYVVSGSTIRTPSDKPGSHALLSVKTWHRVQPLQRCKP